MTDTISKEMDEFESWLRTVCFMEPTKEAYYLGKAAWLNRSIHHTKRIEELEAVVNRPVPKTDWHIGFYDMVTTSVGVERHGYNICAKDGAHVAFVFNKVDADNIILWMVREYELGVKDGYDERDKHYAAMRGREASADAARVPASKSQHKRLLAQIIPEGWQLVPKQYTTEMKIAGHDRISLPRFTSTSDVAGDVYYAMLAAAPTPPGGTNDERNMPTHPGQYRDYPFKYPEDK